MVTLTLDLGQGEDLDAVREAALEAGAVRAHVIDVRDELALEYLLPALKACGAQQGGVPLARELRLAASSTLVEVPGWRTRRSSPTAAGHDDASCTRSSRSWRRRPGPAPAASSGRRR